MNLGYFSTTRSNFQAAQHIRAITIAVVAFIFIASLALAADGVLQPDNNSPIRGHYCLTTASTDLGDVAQAETVTVDVNGSPLLAYIHWSGRYSGDQNGDDNVTIAINGGTPVTISADYAEQSYAGYSDRYYYVYRSANLASAMNGTGQIDQTTPFQMTFSGLKGDQGHGAGIVIVYENQSTCTYGDVLLYYGVDTFHHRRDGDRGPNSVVNCVEFDAIAEPRNIDYQMFVGGVLSAWRPNSIWVKTSADPLPADYWTQDIVDSEGAIEIVNPLDGDEGGADGQWDNHRSQVSVPAGHTNACFQIESVPDYAPERLGISAVWLNLTLKVDVPEPPTPTNTPTNTPTDTPTNTPTDTPTNTPTDIPTNTSTPTDTPTDIPTPTNTPTDTPTPTNTPTHTPTPTIEVSPQVEATPTIKFTPEIPTPSPTPIVPVCTSDTDLQVAQAISQISRDDRFTIIISYWNQSPHDLADIYITTNVSPLFGLDPAADNSAWSCSSGTCNVSVGTLPAAQSQNDAQQLSLYLVVNREIVAGQTTSVSNVVIFQEQEGVTGEAACSSEEAATILIPPTSLEATDEPVMAELTKAVFLPVGGW